MRGKQALGNICLGFMDDLAVFKDDGYHARYVAFVLKTLAKHNISCRADKAEIGVTKIAFLGHYADKDGLHVDPDKVKAVNEMPSPTDKAGVRRLLGMAGYLRKFMKDFGSNTRRNASVWSLGV